LIAELDGNQNFPAQLQLKPNTTPATPIHDKFGGSVIGFSPSMAGDQSVVVINQRTGRMQPYHEGDLMSVYTEESVEEEEVDDNLVGQTVLTSDQGILQLQIKSAAEVHLLQQQMQQQMQHELQTDAAADERQMG
jgi:hypothetical protein